LFRRSTLSKVRDYAVWLGICITCISLCSRSRRLPFPSKPRHPNLSSLRKQINIPPAFQPTTSHPHSLRLDRRRLRTTIPSALPGYPQHSKDGCPRLNRHPWREQSICAIQVSAIGYVGFCPIIRNTSNYLLGESAVGKVC
jgi:hypothetical protein